MVAYFSGLKDEIMGSTIYIVHCTMYILHPLRPQDFPRMCTKYAPPLLDIARNQYYFSSIVSFYDFPAVFLNNFACRSINVCMCAFIVIICSSWNPKSVFFCLFCFFLPFLLGVGLFCFSCLFWWGCRAACWAASDPLTAGGCCRRSCVNSCHLLADQSFANAKNFFSTFQRKFLL